MKRIVSVLREIIDIYYENRISRSAAALAYFLTLALFPFLICMTALLRTLDLSPELIMRAGDGIMPAQLLDTLGDFVVYINNNYSVFMTVASVMTLLTSASAAFRQIMNTMTEIQGKPRYSGFFGFILSFILSIIFPIVIYLSFALMLCGRWLLKKLDPDFMTRAMSALWNYGRFLFIFLILYVIIHGIYLLTAPKGDRSVRRYPGAVFASLVLVGVSILFSWFIGMSVKYEVVYGSVASIIILMVWLYTCGNILIMGNVVNIILSRNLREKKR